MRTTKLSVFSLIVLSAVAFAAEKVAISDLLKKADDFDKKTVVLVGKVDNFKAKVSKAGNPYFTFKLLDDKDNKVSIYSRGKLEKDLEDGQKVEVTGTFKKESKVGANTFKNEVDISKDENDKKTKDFGVKVVK
ncbi:MAG: cytochrome c maturation protein CcmE [Fimbriimonadaceae bacterium]